MGKDKKDHAKILGVPHDAGTKVIRRAFRKLALELHPDKNPDDPHAKTQFVKLHESYKELLKSAEAPTEEDPTQIMPTPPPAATLSPEKPKRPESTKTTAAPAKGASKGQPITLTPKRIVAVAAAALVALLVGAWISDRMPAPKPDDVPSFLPPPPPELAENTPPAPPEAKSPAPEPGARPAVKPAPVERELASENLTPAEIEACLRGGDFQYNVDSSIAVASTLSATRQGCVLTLARSDGQLSVYQLDACDPDPKILVSQGDALVPARPDLGDCPFGLGGRASRFATARAEVKEIWAEVKKFYEYGSDSKQAGMTTRELLRCGQHFLRSSLDRCDAGGEEIPALRGVGVTQAADKLDCELPEGPEAGWAEARTSFQKLCASYVPSFLEAKAKGDPKGFLGVASQLTDPGRLVEAQASAAGASPWGVADPIVAAVRSATGKALSDRLRQSGKLQKIMARAHADALYLELRYGGRLGPAQLQQLRVLSSPKAQKP